MDTKRWALFFVFLVCSEHIGSAYGKGMGHPEPGKGCIIKTELIKYIDGCIEKLKLDVKAEKQVEDVVVNNIHVSDCRCEGLHNIKRTACSCTCFEDFIRIDISLSIFDLLFSFVLSLGSGSLAGIIDTLVDVLKKVVNLLVKVLCLKIEVVVVVEGYFDTGRCFVRKIFKPKIGDIEILGIEISGLDHALGGIVGDILSVVLDLLMTGDFARALVKAFNEAIIYNNWHNCPLPPGHPTPTIRPPTHQPPTHRPPTHQPPTHHPPEPCHCP